MLKKIVKGAKARSEAHPVRGANVCLLCPPLRDAATTGAFHYDEKVHTVDARGRVVFEPQVNVLRNPKPKVASVAEVALAELILLDLEPTLQELLGFVAAHRYVACDLLISPDAERAHGVAGCGTQRSAWAGYPSKGKAARGTREVWLSNAELS